MSERWDGIISTQRAIICSLSIDQEQAAATVHVIQYYRFKLSHAARTQVVNHVCEYCVNMRCDRWHLWTSAKRVNYSHLNFALKITNSALRFEFPACVLHSYATVTLCVSLSVSDKHEYYTMHLKHCRTSSTFANTGNICSAKVDTRKTRSTHIYHSDDNVLGTYF